jgi:hypothetical protein
MHIKLQLDDLRQREHLEDLDEDRGMVQVNLK